jgi:chromosome segregation ATPase
MKAMLTTMHETLQMKEDEVKTLRLQLDDKLEQLKALMGVQQRYEELLNDKQKLVETFNAREIQLLNTLSTNREELKTTQQILQCTRNELELLRSQHTQLESHYRDLQTTHQLDTQRMQQEVDQLQASLTSLRSEHEKLNHAFNSLHQEHETLKQDRQLRDSEYVALQHELTRLRHVDEELALARRNVEQVTTELAACQQREFKFREVTEQWEQWRERRNKEFLQLQVRPLLSLFFCLSSLSLSHTSL